MLPPLVQRSSEQSYRLSPSRQCKHRMSLDFGSSASRTGSQNFVAETLMRHLNETVKLGDCYSAEP